MIEQEAPADGWRGFDRWAAVLCLVLAAVTLIASLLVASDVGSSGASPAFVVFLVASGVATALVQWLGWWGLQGPRPWGRSAATWILTVTAVAGAIGALVDLTQSRLTIPIAAIAAIVILARRPGPNVADQAAMRKGAATGLALMLLLLAPAVAGWAATSPASPFVASAGDLDIAIVVDCARSPGAMPDRVDVTVTWSWRTTDAVVLGPDGMGIGWSGDPDGSWQYAVESATVSDESMLVAGSAGLAGGVVEETLAPLQSSTWAVEAVDGLHAPGDVRLTLVPAAAALADRPADGQLLVQFVYAHLDRWTVEDGGRCEW